MVEKISGMAAICKKMRRDLVLRTYPWSPVGMNAKLLKIDFTRSK
jgi:hypothetical protein